MKELVGYILGSLKKLIEISGTFLKSVKLIIHIIDRGCLDLVLNKPKVLEVPHRCR